MLGENELRQVGEYVKQNLRGWMDEVLPDRLATSIQLLERMVRLEEQGSRVEHRSIRMEEELKAQRELMEVKFDAVHRRFEASDKRFTLIQWVMGVGFVMIGTLVTVFGVLG